MLATLALSATISPAYMCGEVGKLKVHFPDSLAARVVDMQEVLHTHEN